MKLPNTTKPIRDSKDYVDIDGSVYTKETRKGHKYYGEWMKRSQHKCWGYMYCAIYRISQKRSISMRVHRLVAEAFVPNPNPEINTIVGHRNNIKHDNRAANLYWTTSSENTQKAVDDGLLVNNKGWEDSQSMPVSMYNVFTNEHIEDYGSASEAERQTGIQMSTILRQCRYHRPLKFTRKPYYFRFVGDETTIVSPVINCYDMQTDELLGQYLNFQDAERVTGINARTINDQTKRNRKPKWSKSGMYFLCRNAS